MADQLQLTRAGKISEKQLQANAIELAHHLGWTVAHFRPALTKHGWRTPVAADGAGFPDLILIHGGRGRILVRELKVGKNTVSPDQVAWLGLFEAAGIDAGVWREADWYEGRILADLRGDS